MKFVLFCIFIGPKFLSVDITHKKIPSPCIILTSHFIIDNAIKVTVPKIINIFTHSFNWIVPCSLEPLISLDLP